MISTLREYKPQIHLFLKMLWRVLLVYIAFHYMLVILRLDYRAVNLPNGTELRPVYWSSRNIALYHDGEPIITGGIYKIMYTDDVVYGTGGGHDGNHGYDNMPFYHFYYSAKNKQLKMLSSSDALAKFTASKGHVPFNYDTAKTYQDLR